MSEKDYYYSQGQGQAYHVQGYHPPGAMEMMPPPPPPPGGIHSSEHYGGNSTVLVKGQRVRWSWCSTGFSVIALWCCCPVFGFFGLLCSILSYTDHKAGDEARSSYKRKCAWCWTIFSILLGIGFIVLIAVYVGYITQLLLDIINNGKETLQSRGNNQYNEYNG